MAWGDASSTCPSVLADANRSEAVGIPLRILVGSRFECHETPKNGYTNAVSVSFGGSWALSLPSLEVQVLLAAVPERIMQGPFQPLIATTRAIGNYLTGFLAFLLRRYQSEA